jgi:preprotein translocase subunit SecF
MKFRFRIVKEKTNVNFTGVHKLTLCFGFLLIMTTIVLLMTRGLSLGIDFTGGVLIEIQKPETMSIETVRHSVANLSEGAPMIQEFGNNSVMLKIPGREVDAAAQKAIYEEVQQALGSEVEFRRAEYVGPQVGKELIMTGVKAFLWSMLGILLYIWARFEWQFGVAAVLALVHDGCATMMFFLLTGFEFDLSTVAAVLLISGYSINETVVVFDRIREMMRKYKKMPMPELINLALNDTLSRTLMTSLTTFTCMACLAHFGTEAIKGFSYAMLVGIFFGPFSSIFISSPLLIYMNLRRSPAEAKTEEATA